MKEKWKTIRLVYKEVITLYKWTPWIVLGSIIVKVMNPLLTLLLPTLIVSWLLQGMPFDTFFMYVSMLGISIIFIQFVEFFLNQKVSFQSEVIRMSMTDKISMYLLKDDYPKYLKEEHIKIFKEAMHLTDMPGKGFGDVLFQVIQLSVSLISSIVYIHLLAQIEFSFQLLAVGFFILIVIFSIAHYRLDNRLYASLSDNKKKEKYTNSILGSSIFSKDIRLYNMIDWLTSLRKKLNKDYKEINRPKRWLSWFEMLVVGITMLLLHAFTYMKAIDLVVEKQLLTEQFLLYASTFILLTTTLLTLTKSLIGINQLLKELGHYTQLVSQKNVFLHEKGAQLPKENIEITFQDVGYRYPNSQEWCFQHLNFTIKANERLAIVGENGAGKTTLIQLLVGLLQPTEGDILINGISQSQYNIDAYYQLFSPVFQDNFLWTYTIQETILQGKEMDQVHYENVLVLSGMDKVIEQMPNQSDKVAIVPQVDLNAVRLSGGQMQTLRLAQALYKNSPVMVLDEPTAAMDPIAESKIYEKYAELTKNKTAIFISHRLASTRFCDRIFYLSNGQIKECGTHDTLMAQKGDYYQLFETQAHYYRQDKEESK